MDRKALALSLAFGLLSSGSALAAPDRGKLAFGASGADKLGERDSCSGKDGCGSKKDEKKKDKS